MADDWDFDDGESSVRAGEPLNFFKKKEAIIELSAMIDYEERPMPASEILDVFNYEFGQAFPHVHFGYDTMENFLDDIREVVHAGDVNGHKTYVANPQYKYHLLRAKARGGKSRRARVEERANQSVDEVQPQQHGQQAVQHQQRDGGFGMRGGRRGGPMRLFPTSNAPTRAETTGSRFNGAPARGFAPHRQGQVHQRPQQGQQQLQQHQQQGQGRQEQKASAVEQPPQQLTDQDEKHNDFGVRQEPPTNITNVPASEVAAHAANGVLQNKTGQWAALARPEELLKLNKDPIQLSDNNNVAITQNGPASVDQQTVSVVARKVTVPVGDSAWGPTEEPLRSVTLKAEDDKTSFAMPEEVEPYIVPIGGARAAEEKKIGGGQQQAQRRGQEDPRSRSYLDDMLDLNLNPPQHHQNVSVVNISSDTTASVPQAVSNNQPRRPFGDPSGRQEPVTFVPRNGAQRENKQENSNVREMLNMVQTTKEEPYRSVFDMGGEPNSQPPMPRPIGENRRTTRGLEQPSSWSSFAENMPTMPMRNDVYQQAQLLRNETPIMTTSAATAAAQQHEISTHIEQMVLRTVASSTVTSEPDLGFEDAVDFLKNIFTTVGKKFNSQCIVGHVMDVVEANQKTFGFVSENGKEYVVLLRSFDALSRPGVVLAAALEDLIWILRGKSVAHKDEPYDLARILYQTEDVIICVSTSFGVQSNFRIRGISEGLSELHNRELHKALSYKTGKMYVAAHDEHLVRVILTGQNDIDSFNAILVDAPGGLVVKNEELWEVPGGWDMINVPGNVYLARHANKIGSSQTIAQLISSGTELEMRFLAEKANDGVRYVDWLNVPAKTTWFSGEKDPDGIEKTRTAVDLRVYSHYFGYKMSSYLSVMEPYAQRKKFSHHFVAELSKVVGVVVNSQQEAEQRKDIAARGLELLTEMLKQFALPDGEARDAVKFYEELDTVAHDPTA